MAVAVSVVNRSLRLFSITLTASVIALIFIGALVTSNQAGLAVPDWPTTYGENMFLFPYEKWQGGIFYEHGHRLFASFVGFLTVILFVWTLFKEERRWVKVLTGAALFAVILQGVLGGLTVLYFLPAWLSTAHAVLAQTFLGLAVLIAFAHSEESTVKAGGTSVKRLFRLSLWGVLFVYAQLLIGAYMRHTYSGLAIPDFPTMAGSWLPSFGSEALAIANAQLAAMEQWPVTADQMFIHFLHRVGAVVVAVFFMILVATTLKTPGLSRELKWHAVLLLGLVLLQFAMGVVALLTAKEPILTSVHVVLGAIFLSLSVLFAGRLFVRLPR